MASDDNNQYVTVGRLVSGLGLVILLIVGWLFSMMTSSTREMQENQSVASVRSAVNHTRLNSLDEINKMRRGRISSLETSTAINTSAIEQLKYELRHSK